MRIGERFEVLEVLGEGAQGAVYAVRDAQAPTEPRALKTLRDPSGAALLRLEFDRLRSLEHPNLVHAIEWIHDPPALLMEWVRGPSLLEAAASAGEPGAEARVTHVLELAAPLLRGLEHLHAAGYVHLDVKPANVRVDGERAVLLDLGFAARSGEVAERGTPGYAAPEVHWGWPVDRRADLHALGATLLHAATGAAPAGDALLDSSGLPPRVRDFLDELIGPREQRASSAGLALQHLATLLGPALPPVAAGELPAIEGPLREREAELEALASEALVFVVGPRGSGKSRLLREAAGRRRAAGARVFQASFRDAPPAGFGLLAPLLSRLGVSAVHEATSPEQAQARLVVEVARGVIAYAREGVCTLVFDDLDAAAPDALAVVLALTRALEGQPQAAVWLSWATDAAPTGLTRLQRERGAAPVLVLERVSELSDTARLKLPTGEAREVLEALALLDRPLGFAELIRWRPTALESIPALLEGGLAQRVGDGSVALAARELRAELVAGASSELATALVACAEAPADRARLALHAGDPERAVGPVVEGARAEFERGAQEAARALLEQLFALGPPSASAARAQLLAARIEFAGGEEAAGLSRLEQLLSDEAAPALERARAAGLAARRRYRLAEDDAALALAARAEELAGSAPAPDLHSDVAHVRTLVAACRDPQTYVPDPQTLEDLRRRGASGDALAKLGTALGIVFYRGNRLADAERLLARASSEATSGAARGWALLNLGVCLQRQGRDADAERATSDARTLLEHAGDVVGVATADLESGLRLLRQSRYTSCAAVLEPVLATFAALGDDARVAELRLNLGAAWLRMGALDRAREHFRAAASGLKEPGLLAFCAGDLAWLEAEALDDDAARAALARSAEHAAQADPFFGLQASIQRASVLVRLGDPAATETARAALEQAKAVAPDLHPAAAVALAEAAAAAGEPDARALAETALRVATGSERARAGAALALACVQAGEPAAARRAAQRAVDAASEADDVFERCLARLALARALAAEDDTAGLRRELAAVVAIGQGSLPRIAAEAAAQAAPTLSALERSALLEGNAGGLLAKVVAGAPDAGHMLDLSIGLLVEATGAERGLLVLLDDALQPTETAARNMRDEELSGPGSSYSRRLVHTAAEGGEPVLIRDALVDPRFVEAESVATLTIRSVLAIPVRGDGAAPLAVLYLDDRTQPGRFGDDALELAERLTSELAPALRLARERATLQRDVAGLRSRVAEAALDVATSEIVGASAPVRALRVSIARAARTALPVLVEGESGSGKELIARAIHTASPRAEGPFVAESCAAVVDALLESELFGHVRGAFTGADRDREGIFAQASGGTLFLDEVNSMSPSMQSKLLRVLQEGVVRPVGAEATRRVDVRVIAASNEALTACVAAGRFREDLYYRLAVMELRAPSLRERADDVPLLLDHFLRKHADGSPPDVTDAALRTLTAYAWPGNVRELENAVRRLLALRVPRVLVRHLPSDLRAATKDARPGQDPVAPAGDLSLNESLERLERDLIARALRRCKGNVSQAARQLGIERTKLTRRIKRLGIEG